MSLDKFEITSKGKRVTVRSARARMSYPAVFFPSTQQNEDGSERKRYGTSLLFPKGTDFAALEEAVDTVAKEKFGADYAKKFPKLRKPFLKTSDYPNIGVDADQFPVLLRTSSDAQYGRPGVVDAQNRPVSEDKADQVYAGRWCRTTLSVFAYDRAGNKGVSLGLNNLQLLADDEPLAGTRRAPDSDFEAVPISGDASEMFQ